MLALRTAGLEPFPNPGFSAVLVYDVSRWGRFPDPDEAAVYEHACKSRGIRVIYYYISQRGKIYLLLAYPKNKQENLSDAQKDALRAIINQLE